jgi:hypothetical protein
MLKSGSSVAPLVRYVDAREGRALSMKRAAEQRGISAKAYTGHIEDVLQTASDRDPVNCTMDRVEPVVHLMQTVEETPRVVMGSFLLRPPSSELWGVRFVLTPSDVLARRETIRLFERIAELTARRSSAMLVGEKASPEHLAVEPKFRAWMGSHTREQLSKVAAGLPPEANPLEVTMDGETTLPVIIEESDEWREPTALAREMAENPPLPLLRGESFIVAEVTLIGIRFHHLRLRQTDGRMSVRGQTVFDRQAIEEEQREVLAERAAEALRRAERLTASRTAPLLITD